MTPERFEEITAALQDWIEAGVKKGIPAMFSEMWAERGWQIGGFDTFDQYCAGRLGGWRLALPREERREVASQMAGQGMSTRAIGSALGVSDTTIVRDLAGASPEAPAPVVGLDGKSYPRPPKAEDSAPRDPEAVEKSRQQLQDFIESDPSHNDRRYVINFLKSLTPVTDVPKYDAEKLARLLGADEFFITEKAIASLTTWLELLRANRRPRLIGVQK